MLVMRTMVIQRSRTDRLRRDRRVAVSVPYAAQLIDGVKYMLPRDVKPPEADTDLRRHRAPLRADAAIAGPVGAEGGAVSFVPTRARYFGNVYFGVLTLIQSREAPRGVGAVWRESRGRCFA